MTALADAEVRELRREFPALDHYAYFATNGLGILPRRAGAAVSQWVDRLSRRGVVATMLGNPPLLDETRARVARLLGCDADEIAFSRNTSEGVLWVANGLPFAAGDEVIVAQGEYSANVLPWMAQDRRGVVTRLLRQDERRVTPALVAAAWGPRTRLLAVSFVQYNSGFRADLRALADAVHQRGGLIFCDAIQGLGALRLDIRQTGVDFLAAGAHKWLLGPQGLGIFYCRRERLADLEPLHIATGSLLHDDDPGDADAPYDRELVGTARRFEEGTRNYLGIAALNESLQLLEAIGLDRVEARVRSLTDYVVAEVSRRGCGVESPRDEGEWSGILLFRPPPGTSAAALVSAMHARRISINAREGCIHMGVHFYNTTDEIDRVLACLDEARSQAARGAAGGAS